jgi:hypothetical protein
VRAIKTITISILAVGLLAGSAVGVAAQGAAVSGFQTGDCEPAPDGPDGVKLCTGRFALDDPRLTGDYEILAAEVFQEGGDGFEVGYARQDAIRISNDDGAWSGHGLYGAVVSDDASLPEEERVIEVIGWVLSGEDGYEGLTAYLGIGGPGGIEGVIIEGTLPELPGE